MAQRQVLVCPRCEQPSFAISAAIELPARGKWDEIALQIVDCRACRFEGIALYRISRPGPAGRSVVEHEGYFVNEETVAFLRRTIEDCTERENQRCECASHRLLDIMERREEWESLIGGENARATPFLIEIARVRG